jgi:hypothetical protein
MMFWRLTSSTRYVSSIGIISNVPPMNHLLSILELMFNDDARLIYFVLRFLEVKSMKTLIRTILYGCSMAVRLF